LEGKATMSVSGAPKIDWSTNLYIGGCMVAGEGELLTVTNPATEQDIATFNQASPAQLDDAVRAARTAFDAGGWADGATRRDVLLRLADLLEQHREEFGAAIIEEVGTPANLIAPLQLGVPLAALRYYADMATVDHTSHLGPDQTPGIPSESLVRQVPVGVVAAITAYNYPILMLGLKIAPALAAGCTVVVLPSPQTPLSTLLFGKLLEQAGVPDGVVNIVVGGTEIGQALSEHPDVDKISFTGSVPVGSAVMQQAAKTITGVVLELGGKSATIVLPNADLSTALGPIHLRYLRNAGQGCASPTRILVHRDQLDGFIARSQAFFPTVNIGDPRDIDTICGPLISEAHLLRVEGYVERAIAAGGRIVAGGGRPDLPHGWYMNPTLIAGVNNSDEICREELFGPVGVVMPYDEIEDAIAVTNDSHLGLAAAIFGPTEEAKKVAAKLRVGSVYINGGGATRMDAPMGGFKQSGIGREYGIEALFEYLEPQHIQWSTA
jgi:aldehyde dehydrogenase (NAD+)